MIEPSRRKKFSKSVNDKIPRKFDFKIHPYCDRDVSIDVKT